MHCDSKPGPIYAPGDMEGFQKDKKSASVQGLKLGAPILLKDLEKTAWIIIGSNEHPWPPNPSHLKVETF